MCSAAAAAKAKLTNKVSVPTKKAQTQIYTNTTQQIHSMQQLLYCSGGTYVSSAAQWASRSSAFNRIRPAATNKSTF